MGATDSFRKKGRLFTQTFVGSSVVQSVQHRLDLLEVQRQLVLRLQRKSQVIESLASLGFHENMNLVQGLSGWVS